MTDLEEKRIKATESRRRTRALNKEFGDCSTAYALHLLKETPTLAKDDEDNAVVIRRVLTESDPVDRLAWVTQYRENKTAKKQAKQFVPRVAELAKAVEVPVAKEFPRALSHPIVAEAKAKAITDVHTARLALAKKN